MLDISARKFMFGWCLFALHMNWSISSLFCVPREKLVIDIPFPLKGFKFARILIISVATAEIKMLAKAAKETPSLCNVSFHIVGLPVCTVSVIGKNPMRFAVFWRISVRFCGFQTPLTPPPFCPSIQFVISLSICSQLINLHCSSS